MRPSVAGQTGGVGHMTIRGRVWRYGDNVDTDAIIPARYLNTSSPGELAKHCMEDVDPSFASEVEQGDIIVAGANFGCGSSREHAPVALKAAGISCVVAGSFARIFYRNAINIGLPILECPEAVAQTRARQELEVGFSEGIIRNLDSGETYWVSPYPPFMLAIVEAGGLVEYTRKRLLATGEGG